MIMDMGTVCVCCYQKSVFSFGEPHSQLVANPVGFLRCNLPRFEGLANLIGNHIVLLPSAGDMEILSLSQKKFLVCRHGIAFISAHQFAFFRLFRILSIISPVAQALCNGFPFVDMQCNQSCCRHSSPSSPQQKRRQAVPLIIAEQSARNILFYECTKPTRESFIPSSALSITTAKNMAATHRISRTTRIATEVHICCRAE